MIYRFLLYVFIFLLLPNTSTANTIRPVAPTNGMTLRNNMPTLAWEKYKCDSIEVWINNRKAQVLGAHHNAYVPFALSFGKHSWHLVAIKGKQRIKSATSTFIVDDAPLAEMPEKSFLLRNNWYVKSSLEIGRKGSFLSGRKINTDNWAVTTLPATVLTALVRNQVYPNPYVGQNNMRIPDSNDEYNSSYDLLKYSHIKGRNPWKDPYWFRTEFKLPENFTGKQFWLNFSEINYKAEVWLNGKMIADTTEMIGMERKFRFNISNLLSTQKTNILAVAIYPVINPGKPAVEPLLPLSDPGQNMGDGLISTSYTKWDTMGWDWQPAIRDRDMGITEDVYISATNDIEVHDLYVAPNLILPDTTTAYLTVKAELTNHSKAKQSGVAQLKIVYANDTIALRKAYELQPETTMTLNWDYKTDSALIIRNPRLWWPAGYGSQPLYTISIDAKSGNGAMDRLTDLFGIRQVDTYIGKNERVYRINGKEIYLKGGNWVIDMMLNWTASRYEQEILLSKNANLNILRVWGPTGVPPKAMYRAADKQGILMWQDFLNDFWGTHKNTPGYQPEIKLVEKATADIVKKYRNHPSLIIWCGGNEGVNPREDLIVNTVLKKYDNTVSRHYLKQSDGDGLHGGGPYHTIEPADYYTHTKLHGFSSEIGPSGVPVSESMKKFMFNMGKTFLPGRFPLDGEWAYHDANDWPGEDTRKFSSYDNIVRNFYGTPDSVNIQKGVSQYLEMAQLVNYDVYRSAIESINSQLWRNSSGILLWKSNSSWPSITWQLYDWYMQAHAGYYGAKKAAGLINVQLHRHNNTLSVLNLTSDNLKGVQLKAGLYDVHGKEIWSESESVTMGSNCVINSKIKVPTHSEVRFVKLQLSNATSVLADNFYWINDENKFMQLKELAQPELEVSATQIENGIIHRYELVVQNKGGGVAFMFNASLAGQVSEQEILPSYWSDNYISLLPGESKKMIVEIDKRDLTEEVLIIYSLYAGEKVKLNIKKLKQ